MGKRRYDRDMEPNTLPETDGLKRVKDLIRTRLEEMGITARALADAAGITRHTLTNFTQGRTTPTERTLGRLEEALGVARGDLLAVRDNPWHEPTIVRKGPPPQREEKPEPAPAGGTEGMQRVVVVPGAPEKPGFYQFEHPDGYKTYWLTAPVGAAGVVMSLQYPAKRGESAEWVREQLERGMAHLNLSMGG